jgi:hypothetical protein
VEISKSIFYPLIEELQKTQRLFAQQIAQQIKFVSIADSLKAYVQRNKDIWSDLNKAITRGFAAVPSILDKAELLGGLGWTIPGIASPAEYSELVATIHDISSADKAFTEFYIENERERLKELKGNLLNCRDFRAWAPALQEAFLDLDDGRNRSCTALLLPLVEGATLIRLPGFKSKRLEIFFKNKFKVVKDGTLSMYMWRSYRAFARNFFKSCSATPSLINRNWLLHGRDIPSSNLSDCLRLLQTLETLAHLE